MNAREFIRISRMIGFGGKTTSILLFLLLLAAAFEGLGIAMLMPIVQFIKAQGDVGALAAESVWWVRLIWFYDGIGVP